MYKHILIATDGSDLSWKAVEQGVALAKALGAAATFVTATEPWTAVVPAEMAMTFSVEDYAKGAAANARRILEKAEEAASKAAVTFTSLHLPDVDPADGIVTAADKNDCDVIVMASHGRRGLTKFILGSVATKVVSLSNVPVLICR